MEVQLKEKVDAHSEILLKKDDLERELHNREVEIKELRKLSKELENQLDAKSQSEAEIQEVRQRLHHYRVMLLLNIRKVFRIVQCFHYLFQFFAFSFFSLLLSFFK